MIIAIEDIIWLTLASSLVIYSGGEWQTWLSMIQSLWYLAIFPPSTTPTINNPTQKWKLGQESGLGMSLVMAPALLQAMAIYCHNGNDYKQQWTMYAKLVTLIATPSVPTAVAAYFVATVLDTSLQMSETFFFIFMWILIFSNMLKYLEESFTYGELRAVCSLIVVVVFEWKRWLTITDSEYDTRNSATPITTFLYPLVAMSGSIGCIIVSAATPIFFQNYFWWLLIFNIAGPLMVVEISLIAIGATTNAATKFPGGISYLPISLQWLFRFLTGEENGFPRYFGLIYWIVILTVSSLPTYYLLFLPSQKVPVVVTRKWFHLIAVLLFGPTTYQFPQLMSLAYAIAVCILIVLETMRRDVYVLQTFYLTFLDDRKDHDNLVIVSHIFLILGCAAPLWISEALGDHCSSLLLAEFGVICVGIGDAMGAVCGKYYGKHSWGRNQRTVEGSLAMWLSMLLVGVFICRMYNEYFALVLSAAITTLLEAFTIQLDNLALPLAGSAIILLLLSND